MIIRKLEINDYYLGLLELLSQLTDCNIITFDDFVSQYLNMGSNYNIYVIQVDNKIVGYGCLYKDYKFYRNCSKVGHIEDIVIHEDYRGKGYAKIIIDKLIEIAKDDCYKILLNCDEKYVEFYNKFGLKKYGENMAFYFNKN